MKNNFLLISLLISFQFFVLNNVIFFEFIMLSPIIMIFITFWMKKDSKTNLLFAFMIGIAFDLFNNSLGVFSLALVLIVFFRNLWASKIVGEEKLDEIKVISLNELGSLQFFYYSFPLLLFFFCFLSLFESGNFFSLKNFSFIVYSTISNYVFMIIFQLLFLKSNSTNEWR